jgi:hypothetical protein
MRDEVELREVFEPTSLPWGEFSLFFDVQKWRVIGSPVKRWAGEKRPAPATGGDNQRQQLSFMDRIVTLSRV